MGFVFEEYYRALPAGRFGRPVRYLPETDSTINQAWQWMAEGADGGVVIADRQRQGKGRNGRAWSAPEGGLWLSVLTKPELPVAHTGRLGLVMALAVADAVEAECGIPVGLKWPNDVMVSGRKLAGILVETQVMHARITAAVLSVGVNVNNTVRELPEEMRNTAISLREITNMEQSLERLAARVMEALHRSWPKIERDDDATLPASWEARDVLRGQEVYVEVGLEHIHGPYRGIDSTGALVLWMSGTERRITAGEIIRVRTEA